MVRSASALRAPGGVLLISCYELGHQPLGTALPAAFLERAGFAPAQFDLAVEPLDAERVSRAAFVGLAVPMHTALRLGVRAAARVRQVNRDAHVCFYGLYAWLNAEHLLAHGADSVIGGEVEGPLLALVEQLEGGGGGGGGGSEAVPGVTRRGGPRAAPFLERLPFAPPVRDGLPGLERYARLERGGASYVAGYVEASRGCLHRCRHCPIPPVYGGRFFVVPREVVMADVRRQVAAGAAHITFGDPDFLNGPGHSLKLARALHAEFPSVTFDFTAKIEHLVKHRAGLLELAALGAAFVVSAVESLSDTVLRHLDKGHTRDDVIAALEATRAAGLALRPSLVPFTPWATLDDYVELLDFVAEHDLVDAVDPVQYAIRLLVPPGSLLLEEPAMRPHLGALDPAAFTYRWTHPDPRMDALAAEVSALVEAASRAGEDPFVTFGHVREAADRAAGRPGRPVSPPPAPPADRRRLARLTEPWFC